MLRESESAEAGSARFNSLSPISYALKKADDENLSWVILTQGSRLRLYATDVGAGVGRRGRTETYIECQPSLLAEEHTPYLWLLYSAEALTPDGSLRQVIEGSQRFAGDLAERLRERIYDHVVPELARGIAEARGIDRPGPKELARTYEMALTVLFRLLFIAYAEDRDLLPYRHNDSYRRRSLKQKAQELAVAESDLVLKKQKGELVYASAKKGDQPNVSAGETYLHNRSGTRKSSGSYYTKPFAVEHLLNGALEPALSDHLPGVRTELAHLRSVALGELGDLGESTTIEDGQLLRRLIARRCIYGVDLNDLSVQLARLAVWIHTFVPGLPLSFLDHNLVHGNSLVGVGTLDEIKKEFEKRSLPLFPVDAQSLLGQAATPLRRLANINDASLQDIAAAREAAREAREAIRSTKALCDLIAAQPISEDLKVTQFRFERWEQLAAKADKSEAARIARQDLSSLQALHFPVAFPEVFLRERPGFDVIIGNPPWQEATIEEHAFWARHFPGLRALPQRQQEAEKTKRQKERPDLVSLYQSEVAETERMRKALVGGAFPGMGTGDPDLYKAFCWRFWRLAGEDGGRIGVVLPRSALAAKGSTDFRQTIFDDAERVDVTMLVNNRQWVFPEVYPQYSIGLVCVKQGKPEEESIYLRGPYATRPSFDSGVVKEPAAFYSADVRAWNDSVSLPLLPNEESVGVFAQLRKAPRLDLNEAKQWRARPDTELHATAQKNLMDLESEECPDGFWPVYKGESFDLWTPDTGTYYAWADPGPAIQWIQSKRLKAGKSRRDSAHREFPPQHLRNQKTLPCFAPRVAFRDVSRATDSRTVRVALVPPEVFIGNQAPYLLWPRGDEQDQAYLVAVLSSISLDWYARRFVETHVNFFVFNPFPIPRPQRRDVFWKRAVKLAGRLACPDKRFADWAQAVGVQCGPLTADEKEDMIHELDAVVAHLYGLSEPQLVHIFKTFHEGWDYQDRLDGVLRHFKEWRRR